MIIGLDVDGILVDQIGAVIPYLKKMKQVTITKEEWRHWGYNRDVGVPDDELLNMMNLSWRELRENMPKVEADVEKRVQLLRDSGHRVSIVTHRSQQSIPYVLEWLELNGVGYDDFIQSRGDRSKFEFGIDVLIDDSPKCIEEVGGYKGKRLYLRTQPWNEEYKLVDGVTRVESLSEAAELILKR